VPTTGQVVTFSGAESAAPDSAVARYEWDLDGDGTTDARGRTTPYTFFTPGEHTVALRVTDADGGTDTATVTLRVNARPTAALTYAPPVPAPGEIVRFDASASVDTDGTITAYEWDFDADGVTDARGETATHTFGTVGNRTVMLRVIDDAGATAEVARHVLVNDRPNVSYTGPSEVPADTAVTLTAAVTDEVGSSTVTWRFPDGTSATGTTVTHTFDPGRQTVTVTAEDEYGARSAREVTLTVRAPSPSVATGAIPEPSVTETTAGSGPGFGGTVAVLAFGGLSLVFAFVRRGSATRR
jgi:PKD repeat protein